MSIRERLGYYIPFVGWGELPRRLVEALAEVNPDVKRDRRYRGFNMEWLGQAIIVNPEEIGAEV